MTTPIALADPAADLWKRVSKRKLERIEGFIQENPVRIGAVAEGLGIEVISLTLPPNISGLIKQLSPSESIYQIQVNNTDVAVRQRFTVAHEVAHFLLHRALIGTDGVTDNILFRSKLSNRAETEANRLAAALLLPWDKVRQWHMDRFSCQPDASHIDDIAAAFKVSTLAVGFRFDF